jgi:hypothetical protein
VSFLNRQERQVRQADPSGFWFCYVRMLPLPRKLFFLGALGGSISSESGSGMEAGF